MRKFIVGIIAALSLATICALPMFAYAGGIDYDVAVEGIEAADSHYWVFDGTEWTDGGGTTVPAGAENYAVYDKAAHSLTLKGTLNFTTMYGIDIDLASYDKNPIDSFSILCDGDVVLQHAAVKRYSYTLSATGANSKEIIIAPKEAEGSLSITNISTLSDGGECFGLCVYSDSDEDISTKLVVKDLSELKIVCSPTDGTNLDVEPIMTEGDVAFSNVEKVSLAGFLPSDKPEVYMYFGIDAYGSVSFKDCPDVSIAVSAASDTSCGLYAVGGVQVENSNVAVSVGKVGDDNGPSIGLLSEIGKVEIKDLSSSLMIKGYLRAAEAVGFSAPEGMLIFASTAIDDEPVEASVEWTKGTLADQTLMPAINNVPVKQLVVKAPAEPEPTPEPLPAAGDAAPFAGIVAFMSVALAGLAIARRRLA